MFVRGALPGEVVAAEVTAAKKDWARAVTVAVEEPSPERVVPPCPSRRAGCGGCGWQHLTLQAQRRARVDIVTDALRRTGGIADPVVELRWRRRCRRLPHDDPRRRHRRRHARLPRRALPRRRGRAGVPRRPPGVGRPPADAATRSRRRADAADVRGHRRPRRAAGTPRPAASRGLPDGTRLGGRAALHEDVAGHRLRVSMGSFFQSGPQAAELLVGDGAAGGARARRRRRSSSTPTPASACSPRCVTDRARRG